MNHLPTLLLFILVATFACSSEEAPRVPVPIRVAAVPSAPFETDLGYTITLTRARAAVRDLAFTIGGKTHARLKKHDVPRGTRFLARLGDWLLPAARAHPGHAAGGEVTGALPGTFVIDWLDLGAEIGTATLIVGDYSGLNLTFRRATAGELLAGDSLVGHSFELGGTAQKDGRSLTFSALVDIEEGANLVGAPFLAENRGRIDPTLRPLRIDETTGTTLELRLLPKGPTQTTDSLFTQIDFFALAGTSQSLAILPGTEAHNRLGRVLQTHDHYTVTAP